MARMPPAFFEAYDNAAEEFDSYCARFEAYTDCCNISGKAKVNYFIASCGAKTYDILRKLALPDVPKDLPFPKIQELLTGHFNPAPIVDICVFNFNARKQKEGESFNDFYAALKDLSRGCEFNTEDRLNQELRRQIIAGIRDPQLQELFLGSPGMDLEKVIGKCRGRELAQQGVAKIRAESATASTSSTSSTPTPNSSSASQAVHKINETEKKKFHRRKYRGNYKNDKAQPKPQPKATNTVIVCYRCGKRNHRAPECRFKDSKCSKCQKIGHLAEVCGLDRKALLTAATKTVSAYEVVDIGVTSAVPENRQTEEDAPPPKIFATVSVAGTPCCFEVDSGAAFTIVSNDTFQQLGIKQNLQNSRYMIRLFEKSYSIQLKGFVRVPVEYAGKRHNLCIRVVEGDYDSIMGRDWIHPLQIDVLQLCNATATVPKVETVSKVEVDINAEIDKLVSEYSDIFSDDPGRLPGDPVSFKLRRDTVPIFCRARTVPYSLRPAVIKEIDRRVAQGIYVPVLTSEWATPVVPVVKADGSVRLAGDYSVTLNKYMIPEEYPIPNIEDMVQDLDGEYFAKFDVRDAYLHERVTRECAQMLTINTIKGLFEVNCLYFGIQCAPAKWQKRMDALVLKIPGLKSFYDDLRMASKTLDEHLRKLRLFFQLCREYNLRLNKSKCVFLTDRLEYLGYIIDARGVHKTTEKIDIVLNAQRPTNIDELQSFIGLVGYYAKFIPNYSDIVYPLNQLRRKDAPFVWSKSCEDAFQKLKAEIAGDQVLCHYDPSRKLILATDASPTAIGAVLSHQFPEGERPIAFLSRTLTPTEQRYSQLDREALAIYWAVKKCFNYVYGRKFTLVIDCKPLASIFAPTAAKPVLSANRLLNYALFLQGFNYEIKCRRSTEHTNADFASRYPCQTANANQIDVPTWCYINTINTLPVTAKEIGKATLAEPAAALLLAQLRGEKPCQLKYSELAQYSVHDNCIIRNDRVYVPATLRPKILSELHSGHCGVVRCKQLARSYVYWPKIDKDIEEMVASCKSCVPNNPPKEPVHPWEYPEKPWQRIHADIGQIGSTYILVIVDAFSKWPEGFVLRSTTSKIMISCFEECFSRFGLPLTVVTDNGPQFIATEFREFLESNGIAHVPSPPYCPYSNGQAERFIQIVKKGVLAESGGEMVDRLRRVLQAYRRNKCATTGKSPAALMFGGRELRTRLDLVKPVTKPQIDRDASTVRREFKVGDKVLLRMYNNQKWVVGTIEKKCGKVVYLVRSAGDIHKRHVNQLRRAAAGEAGKPPGPLIDDGDNFEIPEMVEDAPPEPEPLPQPNRPSPRRSDRNRRAPRRFSP